MLNGIPELRPHVIPPVCPKDILPICVCVNVCMFVCVSVRIHPPATKCIIKLLPKDDGNDDNEGKWTFVIMPVCRFRAAAAAF